MLDTGNHFLKRAAPIPPTPFGIVGYQQFRPCWLMAVMSAELCSKLFVLAPDILPDILDDSENVTLPCLELGRGEYFPDSSVGLARKTIKRKHNVFMLHVVCVAS